MDLEAGSVPDYRTFVRHLWTYREPSTGSAIGDPPWPYACVFENGIEARLAKAAAIVMMEERQLDVSRIDISRDSSGVYDILSIRFRDLEALHLFMLSLSDAGRYSPAAMQIAEFLMWTLGFRWV